MSRLGTQINPGKQVGNLLPTSKPPYKFLRNSSGMPWVRPADWLALSPVAATEVCFLYAVYQGDSNFLAFSATTSSGDFTVTWGDGTSNSYASGTTVNKQFLWANYSNPTSKGYRQALIRVTGNLTSLDFGKKHPTLVSSFPDSQILEFVVQGIEITDIKVRNSSNVAHNSLESFSFIGTCNLLNTSYMFNGCYSLQSVSLPNTGAVTDTSYMFSSCYSLQSVSLPNTNAVTNMGGMFYGCYSLQSVSLPNTNSVTDMSSMFRICYSLQSVSLPNTGAVTNMSNMFNSCYSLQSVSLPNTNAVTNMGGMFSGCSSLQSVSLPNTNSVTNMSSMFSNCSALQSVSLPNTNSVTNMGSMFGNCSALQEVFGLNGASASSSSAYANMFSGCVSLQSITAINMKYTHSLVNCKLSATALNSYYTALPTVTGQTLTVSGNWGTASDNPAIATAKGWTVTG